MSGLPLLESADSAVAFFRMAQARSAGTLSQIRFKTLPQILDAGRDVF
jgi:hypothetical protein